MFKDSYTKYKIIQPFFEDGVSISSISSAHNIPLRTLQRWCKNYRIKGLEGLKQQQELISLAEVTKLMKEYNIYPQIVGKDDLFALMRLVNLKMGAA